MSIDPMSLLTGAPLRLTHDQTNQPDVQATKMLMDAYHQDDGWHCPRCELVTTNADEFAQHLIDEFAAGMANLAKIAPRIRKPTTQRQACPTPTPAPASPAAGKKPAT